MIPIQGCTSLLPSSQTGTATEYSQHCRPAITKAAPNQAPTHLTPTVSVEPSTRVAQQLSPVAQRIAGTIGALALLNALMSSPPPSTLEWVMLRLQLMERTQLATLEVDSAIAEIVCERDRADQLADRIDEVDGARVKQLTIASIVVGGVAGIVTGGIGLAAAATVGADAMTLGGGVLASWLGVSALFVQSEVVFRHDRNLLGELWEDPAAPQIYSPILWRYLHQPPTTQDESPRTEVLNEWRQKGRLGERDSPDEERRRRLFFSTGGRYSSPDLRARASMLETLEASLRLIHEDLEVLIREVMAEVGWESEVLRIGRDHGPREMSQ
ncbi:MAG: hypothetical protein QM706_12250 [Nitrospira sp.]